MTTSDPKRPYPGAQLVSLGPVDQLTLGHIDGFVMDSFGGFNGDPPRE